MAKKISSYIKLQIPAGQANPAPPVGPALGQHGVNIMEFVKEYNARTSNETGTIVPVHLTVYEDRSFTFVTKTAPASELLRKAAGIPKGSSDVRQGAIGSVTRASLQSIAETKLEDLNASSVEEAIAIIEGTARSMGIIVEG